MTFYLYLANYLNKCLFAKMWYHIAISATLRLKINKIKNKMDFLLSRSEICIAFYIGGKKI